jgi:hypothetical protein
MQSAERYEQLAAEHRASAGRIADPELKRSLARRGIWAGTFQHPSDFRRERR